MDYTIETMAEKTLVGIGIKTTNEEGKGAIDIGNTWGHFFSTGIIEKIQYKKDKNIFGLYTEYEGDFTNPYMFYACCEVTENNEDFDLTTIRVPGGKFAKFSVTGNSQKVIGPLWETIWNTDLDRTYIADYEIYHSDFTDPNQQLIEIYIGIK